MLSLISRVQGHVMTGYGVISRMLWASIDISCLSSFLVDDTLKAESDFAVHTSTRAQPQRAQTWAALLCSCFAGGCVA